MVPTTASPVATAYRLVLTFSPTFPGAGGDALCAAPAAPATLAPADRPVDLAATFCVFDRAHAAARASLPPASSPNFATGLGHVVDAVLLSYDPNMTHDGACFGVGC